MLKKSCPLIVVFTFLLLGHVARGQFLMDMVDTTKDVGKGLLSIYKRFDRIHLTGYLQPQYQVVSKEGAHTYSGGDFPPHSNNRFMLRRGRIRFDYVRLNDHGNPSLDFVFQFDGSERGVFIRDFWGRAFENKWELFAFTMGMFARPFGYEVNLSSAVRESPERGRMSQILMKTERDLGAMVSLEPRGRKNFWNYLHLDAGVFNGQGLTNIQDFDSYKDFIGRAALKPVEIGRDVWFSSGLSFFNGGFIQNSALSYSMSNNAGKPTFIRDSSEEKIGSKLPRRYNGVDAQLKMKHKWGFTEIRGEFWHGTQTATYNDSETPPTLLSSTESYYIRPFNGAFFYFLQNIINEHHQLGIKVDWYDPNTDVSGPEIILDNHFGPADIKYTTIGVGYTYYINDNLKLVLWYEDVTNEKTNLPGFTEDLEDNVLTCRLQFRF